MILKIKRERDGQDWWILDDIRKISVSRPKYKHRNDPWSNEEYDIALLDTMVNEQESQSSGNPLSEEYEYIELICRATKGDEFTVIFDTVAYLCNDEGKTIEKIVGR